MLKYVSSRLLSEMSGDTEFETPAQLIVERMCQSNISGFAVQVRDLRQGLALSQLAYVFGEDGKMEDVYDYVDDDLYLKRHTSFGVGLINEMFSDCKTIASLRTKIASL